MKFWAAIQNILNKWSVSQNFNLSFSFFYYMKRKKIVREKKKGKKIYIA